MKRRDFVYYCPGSVSGSPAYLNKKQAEDQLRRDEAVLKKLESVGAQPNPAHRPHIGGTCPLCHRPGMALKG